MYARSYREDLLSVRLVGTSAGGFALAVGVTSAALRAPPGHPEEVGRRAHHANMRTALAWLAGPYTPSLNARGCTVHLGATQS
jgi:hypothetical protein